MNQPNAMIQFPATVRVLLWFDCPRCDRSAYVVNNSPEYQQQGSPLALNCQHCGWFTSCWSKSKADDDFGGRGGIHIEPWHEPQVVAK